MRTIAALCTCLLALPVLAQPLIDGSAADVLYGDALAVQDTQTGFGNSSLGRPDVANGSELDALYATVYGGNLYLVATGNFETNGNKLELFFDTRPGGQNRLLSTNPGTPNQGLLRMSDDGSGNGLTFTSGFEADFWVSVSLFGNPVGLFVDYAELYVDNGNPGVNYFVGAGATKCETTGGLLTGGDAGAPVMLATADNSNVLGVDGGFGLSDGTGVMTGIEIAIPLAALGNPAGSIQLTAFINGQQHDFISNQFLGGIFGIPSNNLGEPRSADLNTTFHFPVTIALVDPPVGACCNGTVCAIKTQAQCVAGGGIYLGDNTNCDANPCDATPSGRCCIDDGYSGLCEITTAAECAVLGGVFTPGATCEGCPCLLAATGACCIGGVCSIETEADCLAAGGAYVGDYTNCDSGPCDTGACCVGLACSVVRRFECTGRFIGPGTDCSGDPCAEPTITTPFVAGDFQGWNAGSDPMTETAPGSRIWTRSYTLDAGSRHEFKITGGSWSLSLPSSGNAWFFTPASGTVVVTYDGNYYADGWIPARDRLPVEVDPGSWTAVGDWQGWNNANPATAMVPQGGGIHSLTVTNLAPGNYVWKAVRTGSWDAIGGDNRSVNAENIPFTVGSTDDEVTFWVNALAGTVKFEVVSPPQGCVGDTNCDGVVGFGDINPFVAGLTGGPQCNPFNFDINGNGTIGFDDINPFVALLSGGGGPCP